MKTRSTRVRVAASLAAALATCATFMIHATAKADTAQAVDVLVNAPQHHGVLATDYANTLLQLNPDMTYNPFGILVTWKTGTTETEMATAATAAGGIIARTYPALGNLALVETDNTNLNQALAGLGADPHVIRADLDTPVHKTALTNDPYSSQQWDMGPWPGANRPAGATANGVIVAVIDDGIQLDHPDLAAAIWTNPGEIPNNGIDDDHNGYIDDVHGWDWSTGDNNPTGAGGHGIHISGTIGAVADNGIGVSGVAPGAKIMPLRFIGDNGSGWSSDALAALNYAVAKGVRVSNNSWIGGTYAPLETGIANAGAKGHIYVAAAGNSTTNIDITPNYPAAWPENNIITVGATTNTGAIASFSNYGPINVDLGAPGAGIYNTYLNSGYASMSGTSMATPHVTGAIALMLAANPTATVTQIRTALLGSVHKDTTYNGYFNTGGGLDIAAAVAAIGKPAIGKPATAPPPTTPPTTTTTPPSIVPLVTNGLAWTAITPTRIVDTRINQGSSILEAGVTHTISVAGKNGIPAGAKAVSASFVAVNPSGPGHLIVWNCTTTTPVVSTLNYGPGEVIANAATIPLDGKGNLCVSSYATSHLVIDVNGYYTTTGSGKFVAITPVRVADTRTGFGLGTKLAAGDQRELVLAAPTGAQGVMLNVAATDVEQAAYVTIYQCGQLPNTSNLNVITGAVRADTVTIGMSPKHSICVYASGRMDIVVDVLGYMNTNNTSYTAITPIRRLDTRSTNQSLNLGSAHPLTGGMSTSIQITGTDGIPYGAKSVSFNLTTVGAVADGYLTVYPCGQLPNTSNLNYTTVGAVANGADIALDRNGQICVYAKTTTHVIIDLNGYWM